MVKSFLEKVWIKPSKSPHSSPILFVCKKDDTMRMCIDSRALNKLTVKVRCPLPLIDELLDHPLGAQLF